MLHVFVKYYWIFKVHKQLLNCEVWVKYNKKGSVDLKKHIIYVLIALILIIILLISYTIISAKTPIILKIVKMDKDNIIYEVRNISLVN